MSVAGVIGDSSSSGGIGASAVAATTTVGSISAEDEFFAALLSPINGIVFVVCWLLPIVAYTWHRHRSSRRRELAAPLAIFLSELTSGASSGHDRKLMTMFHPAIFRRVERGTIRAMCRCVVSKYGRYVSMDHSTLNVRVRGHNTSVVAKVNFENAVGVTCQAAWVRGDAAAASNKPSPPPGGGGVGAGAGAGGVWQIIGFNVLPLHEGEFDVLSFVQPEDFVSFGERFVSALFAKSPSAAVAMMYATLQEKYQTEQAQAQLAQQIGKVLWACGGLRNKAEVDLTMVDARVVRSGDVEGNRTNGVEMEFAVLGRDRDMKVSLKIVFAELRCSVIRYNVSAQPSPHTAQHQVIVDRDAGTHVVVS